MQTNTGRRLRELRGCMPREMVAEELGISVAALTAYEQGERVPRDEIKERFALFYTRTVQEIFAEGEQTMENKKHTPWMVLDGRINDLDNLSKTLNVLCDHVLDCDENLGVIFLSPLDELMHIQTDLREAFNAYFEECNSVKEEGETE